MDIQRFVLETIDISKFEIQQIMLDEIGTTYLRRGIIGVNESGYV